MRIDLGVPASALLPAVTVATGRQFPAPKISDLDVFSSSDGILLLHFRVTS